LLAEGPYGVFAGRDASRGLATFCLDKEALKDEHDDLSDLNSMQQESLSEWETQFTREYRTTSISPLKQVIQLYCYTTFRKNNFKTPWTTILVNFNTHSFIYTSLLHLGHLADAFIKSDLQ
jgi:hypothetical protein